MGLLHVIPDGLEWKLQVYAIPEAEIVLHQIRDHSDAESSIKSVYFFFFFVLWVIVRALQRVLGVPVVK